MTVSTAIRIISLHDSINRRQEFAATAVKTGLTWEFYDGHTQIRPPLLYSPRKAIRRFGRELTTSEIGCYTSHYKLWEWFLTTAYDQLIIFEDDVCPDWLAIEKLAATDFGGMGINLLRLHATNRFKSKTVTQHFLGMHGELLKGVGIVLGTAAYVLTRQGAETLVKRKNILAPSDWELGAYWEHRLPTHLLFPFPLFTRQIASTIGERDYYSPKKHLSDKFWLILWKIRDKVLKLKSSATNG